MYFSINRTICVDKAVERKSRYFRDIAFNILKARNYTCELCQFHEPELQQVITINNRYTDSDFREDNLMVVCPHCFYGCRLGYSAVHNAIDIIYCPDIEQTALNHMTRTLMHFADKEDGAFLQDFYSGSNQEELKDRQDMMHFASTVLCELEQCKLQASEVYKDFNPGNITQLVSFLYNQDDDSYSKRNKFFEPFRYILKPDVMRNLNKTYSNSVFKKYTPTETLNTSDHFLSSMNASTKNSSMGS